jgi:hypothetical protein
MMINFAETFDRVRECFRETTILTLLVPKLDSVTIIRDVQGKIRLFLEPLQDNFIEESDTAALGVLLAEKLGNYYGKDI